MIKATIFYTGYESDCFMCELNLEHWSSLGFYLENLASQFGKHSHQITVRVEDQDVSFYLFGPASGKRWNYKNSFAIFNCIFTLSGSEKVLLRSSSSSTGSAEKE